MQCERFYSLNDSVSSGIISTLTDFSQLSQIWGSVYVCGGNGVSVLLYAHPQLFKLFKHLLYV